MTACINMVRRLGFRDRKFLILRGICFGT